jgi:perosamine synthetase
MSSLAASIGISQLRKVDEIIEKRQERASHLTNLLKKEAGENIHFPEIPSHYLNVYQLYTILVDKRDELKQYLTEKGIMTKVYFPPAHQTHFYKNILGYDCKLPVTEEIAGKALTLPMYPCLTSEDLKYMVIKIQDFYKNYL